MSELKGMSAFHKGLHSHRSLLVAFQTMAMGDLNAVEFGMAAHLGLAVSCGAITQSELIHLNGRIPRGPYAAGIIIDDAVGLQLETALPPTASSDGYPVPLPDVSPESVAPSRFEAMNVKYREVGLLAHEKKAVRRAHKATFWGGLFDGVTGLVRAPLVRAIPLTMLTVAVVELGYATVALLQVLSGSWISIYIFRRRLFCMLDLVFAATRGRLQGDVIQMSPQLKEELLFLAILAPLAVTDMRASPAPWLDLSMPPTGVSPMSGLQSPSVCRVS